MLYRTLLTLVLLSASFAAGASDRPNILWIIADDLSPDLGCYDFAGVETPNIDRLSKQGARYTSAFATSPVCSSSRSAFITGVVQTTTGTHQHRTVNKKPLPKPIEPVTELMRRAGYLIFNSNSTMRRAGKTDYNFQTRGDFYDESDWERLANERIESGQPFFAQVQIHEPHRDFIEAPSQKREAAFEIPVYYPDHPVVRADWANYLATVEVLDRKVGQVLNRLKRANLNENTVVFFFGDHGRPHYRDKQWLYDGGIQVPLIIRWPEHIEPAILHDELVSLIDIPATTLAIAGLPVPEWMQGNNILADTDERQMIFAARDRCGSTIDRIRCVRTGRFKYIRNFHPDRPYSQHSGYKELQYPGMTVARVMKQRGDLDGPPALFWADQRPAEELYDLLSDPDEVNNLAGNSAHAQTLARLRVELDRWMQRTGDQGRIPETDLQTTIQSSETWYRNAMNKRGLSPHPDPEYYLKWWQMQLGIQ